MLGFCGLVLVLLCILPVYLRAPYVFFHKFCLLIKKKKKKTCTWLLVSLKNIHGVLFCKFLAFLNLDE
jgi:hypothetical protein